MKKLILAFGILLGSITGFSQLDSLKEGFSQQFAVDFYYSYDFNEPFNHNRPDFLYQYNKHNQMSINMALADFSYVKGKMSANIGLNFGDFPSANMAHERQLLNALYEANVNYRFTEDLELTVGMFSSHMGFESALSFDNLLTSHSLASEWTSYYLAGAKLGYKPFKKWYFSFTIANGNQNITESDANTNKAIGGQITFTPNDKLTINYSNLYSNDAPDSTAVFVFYNNFYITYSPLEKLDLVAGFDYAFADNRVTNTQSELFVGSFLARYYVFDKWAVAGRFEAYNDPDGIYMSPVAGKFEVLSYSGGLEYFATDNIKFKLEGRAFSNTSPIFRYDQGVNQANLGGVAYIANNSNILFSVQAKF
ncbi:porin [Salibacteraceae bacterium]|jgi:hypothetical protein|nr:hypothetical protein [Crocinitomicaceae bacterium]MCH9822864.1 porin [Bacteroidota bacterium]MDA7730191.1 porin [Salibacteraceae bacterium]MDA9967925.1 porin [Salibacteraceae bacterium]MDB0058371.1 porin [Salibacteraceae bacterium]|tara:strand:+ start:277652 stop:278746 length:1095 start_codon:yes stop_codon:yes gene_type:complete